MRIKCPLDILPFSGQKEITTLVENRRAITLDNLELNIYETYQQSQLVPLQFNDMVIVSMIVGKKIMHLDGERPFEYLPGETLILPARKRMEIDFPEADVRAPTQCTALAISEQKIKGVLEYLNECAPAEQGQKEWTVQWDKFRFDNDQEIARLTNKLFRILVSEERFKQALADLTLKELLIRVMQTQNLLQLDEQPSANDSVYAYLKSFIGQNLCSELSVEILCQKANMSRSRLFREFRQEFGLTPIEYVIRERLGRAKTLLLQGCSVKECCYAVGFNDVNYFVRSFKKREGITPGVFQQINIR